ncbi:hypothetical protein C1645_770922 [Glomus cerebriforme]|uniref:Uncharacterized protein n=1 Tax=Glomus cerebriforme TaxID=658196 RepID=A0A397SVJ1_9GLOM|nr:hypothetical protein C1645_770922 [Glomus cerebriforme]
MMNRYRTIKDIEKRRYVNELAEDLVINVVRIFHFRLFAQEPIAQYRWIENNEKINKVCMKGSWNEDEIEDMVVEVCSFPLIYKPFPDAPNGYKVCTPARVLPGQIMKQGFMKKVMNIGTSVLEYLYPSNYEPAPSLHIREDEYETSSTDSIESD